MQNMYYINNLIFPAQAKRELCANDLRLGYKGKAFQLFIESANK